MTTPLSDAAWREALPKISLFSHLEATPTPTQWWELLHGGGGDSELQTLADFERMLSATSPAPEAFWAWKSHTLSTPERWSALAEAAARRLAAANVVYAELSLTPLEVAHHGFGLETLLRAVNRGFAEVPQVTARIILDVDASRGAAAVLDLVEEASDLLGAGVVGLHVGVDSRVLDASWAPVRERCDELALHRVIRVQGQDALRAAAQHLAPNRILPSGDWAADPELREQVIRERVCVLLAGAALGATSRATSGAESWPSADWLQQAERDGMRIALAHPLPTFSGMALSEALSSPVPGIPRTQTRAWQQTAAGASAQPYHARRQLLGDLVTDPVWFEELPSA